MAGRFKKMIWILVTLTAWCGTGWALDAGEIVRDSFNYMRGKASEARVTMTIHRPDWEREMTLRVWTEGEKNSLIRVLAPPRDEGNGTLKKGQEMWTYNPKINRVIKLPPSMMSQSWMGSDFSNNDLAKSDSLIYDYTHTLEGTETRDGRTVYRIKSIPRPGAPVVWGMQTLKIREDHILLEERYYDEDMEPVKTLTTSDIREMGDKLFPGIWKMTDEGAADEYTLLSYEKLEFLESLPDQLFTVSSLKTPRR